MAESQNQRIVASNIDVPKLNATRPLPGQEYCAYVYLIATKPENNVHGVINVLCTGKTEKEVEDTVKAMFDSGQLSAHLNFVRITGSGTWRFLIPGGEPTAEKDIYNIKTQATTSEFAKSFDEKRRKQNKELKARVELLMKESQEAIEDDPESFETYKFMHVRRVGVRQQLEEMAKEKVRLDQLELESTAKINELDVKFPDYIVKLSQRKAE
ncbi:MAG: hypothetical protein ACMG6E_03575 [Candidatus Roizmanbacteria bacterium]